VRCEHRCCHQFSSTPAHHPAQWQSAASRESVQSLSAETTSGFHSAYAEILVTGKRGRRLDRVAASVLLLAFSCPHGLNRAAQSAPRRAEWASTMATTPPRVLTRLAGWNGGNGGNAAVTEQGIAPALWTCPLRRGGLILKGNRRKLAHRYLAFSAWRRWFWATVSCIRKRVEMSSVSVSTLRSC